MSQIIYFSMGARRMVSIMLKKKKMNEGVFGLLLGALLSFFLAPGCNHVLLCRD